MAKEMIDEIRRTEAAATQTVTAAEQQGAEKIEQAKLAAKETVSVAREQARQKAEQLLENARAESERQAEQAHREAAERCAELKTAAGQNRPAAMETIIEILKN